MARTHERSAPSRGRDALPITDIGAIAPICLPERSGQIAGEDAPPLPRYHWQYPDRPRLHQIVIARAGAALCR